MSHALEFHESIFNWLWRVTLNKPQSSRFSQKPAKTTKETIKLTQNTLIQKLGFRTQSNKIWGFWIKSTSNHQHKHIKPKQVNLTPNHADFVLGLLNRNKIESILRVLKDIKSFKNDLGFKNDVDFVRCLSINWSMLTKWSEIDLYLKPDMQLELVSKTER